MSVYLIDTNIIAYLADVESAFHAAIRGRFQGLTEEDVACLSILSLYELDYSLSKGKASGTDAGIPRTKEKLCAALPIIPLSSNGAKIFGELKFLYEQRHGLKRAALSRDTVDLIIASTALEIGAVLVSNDIRIFPRIQALAPALKLENWTTG